MFLKRKLAEFIDKKCGWFYILARCINNINDPDLVKLIKGYYERHNEYTSLIITHNGEKYSDQKIYYINQFYAIDKKTKVRDTMGFCAALGDSLAFLYFSDFFGLTPVVRWGETATYYDSGMDHITKNVFEYYFNQVSEIDYREVKDCKNVVKTYGKPDYFLIEHTGGYAVSREEIEKLGYIFKKYIHLNRKTKEYIDNSLKKILGNRRVLAVHVRGTDFNMGKKSHPIAISTEEYLTRTRELYLNGQYEYIFLATDDANALQSFKNEFNDKLLYYTDVFRAEDHIGVHCTPDSRPLHYYKLGLEVLRDVYTLANCDSLICGLSSVSFTARYVNIALDRKYEKTIILDNGLNTKDCSEARKFDRQRPKLNQARKL